MKDKVLLEEPVKNLILEILRPSFHVEREVRGTHWSGKRLRVDAMLRPRDTEGWGDGEDTAFGLEFKKPERRSFKEGAKLLAQAHDYSETRWDGYGYRKIAVYPPLSCGAKPGSQAYAWDGALVRIAAQFGVGELKVGSPLPGNISLEFAGQFVWRSCFNPYTGEGSAEGELHSSRQSLIPSWGAK